MKVFGMIVALIISAAAGFGGRDFLSFPPPPAPETEEVTGVLSPFETDMPGIKPSIVVKPSFGREGGRTYHITQLIARRGITLDLDPIYAKYREEEAKQSLGAKGRDVAESILSIPGVTSVTMRPYSIEIAKGDAFNWEKIEPTALAVIKSIYGDKDVEIRQDESLADDESGSKRRSYDGGGHNFGLNWRRKRDENTIVVVPTIPPATETIPEKKPETPL